MSDSNPQTLVACLRDFQARVGENKRVQALLKGWEPNVIVEATDSGDAYTLLVRNRGIEAIAEGSHEAPHRIQVRGEQKLLMEIFSGKKNPSEAFIDGELEVFGDDRDRIKLDAITLVLWGL
jgi:putative sterol carrier protein